GFPPSFRQINLARCGMMELEVEAFRTWLRGFARYRSVGRARDPVGDPLANYLREQFQIGVMTGRDDVRLGAGVVPLPQWARLFQYLIDENPASASISAGKALKLLATAARNCEQPIKAGVDVDQSRTSTQRKPKLA